MPPPPQLNKYDGHSKHMVSFDLTEEGNGIKWFETNMCSLIKFLGSIFTVRDISNIIHHVIAASKWKT